jgi:hypothetical protein
VDDLNPIVIGKVINPRTGVEEDDIGNSPIFGLEIAKAPRLSEENSIAYQ